MYRFDIADGVIYMRPITDCFIPLSDGFWNLMHYTTSEYYTWFISNFSTRHHTDRRSNGNGGDYQYNHLFVLLTQYDIWLRLWQTFSLEVMQDKMGWFPEYTRLTNADAINDEARKLAEGI
jgi:hypothetical protein